jgi:hypothetical protein
MKKIVILVIVLTLVSVGFLSGCSSNTTKKVEKKTPQELIIGSWTRTDGRLLQFYSNSSYYVHYNTTSYWSTYEINDTHITLYILGKGYAGTYIFKNNNNTIEFTDTSGTIKTYRRN